MINVDNKVKNVYYMLCYVFRSNALTTKTEATLDTEAFENIYELFAEILCIIVKKQLKQGLAREYNDIEEELGLVRGKINLSQTITGNVRQKGKVVCNYDDFNANSYMNQIIKSAMFWLIKSNQIGDSIKSKLKRVLLYFGEIDLIEPNTIRWDKVRYNKNSLSYKFIIHLCYLILNKLIVSNSAGKYSFKEFLDDQSMSSLYERFVREYYRKNYKQFKTSAMKSSWDNLPGYSNKYLPELRTDITLEYGGRMLIIDTKFYSQILKSGYLSDSKIISSNHLNQMYVYVDKQDPQKTGKAMGMLLYAQTINEAPISDVTCPGGHTIAIQTLDMNSDWDNIDNTLKAIGDKFIDNNFVQNNINA